MRISVIGCGYLARSTLRAWRGWAMIVVGVDVDADKVEQLSRGRAPFYEPVLDELLTELEESVGCGSPPRCPPPAGRKSTSSASEPRKNGAKTGRICALSTRPWKRWPARCPRAT